MSLIIVAAKDTDHAFNILCQPIKTVKNYILEETEGIGDFFYDFKDEFLNYDFYYKFDPYREIYLPNDEVKYIKIFANSVLKWISESDIKEKILRYKYGLSFKKIRRFAIALDKLCDLANENGYGLVGEGD